MKTLRIAMVAVLIACTMVSLASTDGIKPHAKKVVNVTFVKALQIPGLAEAMKLQLDPSFLLMEEPVYVKKVLLNGTTYQITGTRAQWLAFFYPKWVIPSEIKPKFGHN